MDDYIKRDSFVSDKRKKYCKNCERRKGKKNGKTVLLYDIGDAPCRACEVDDMLCEVEDYPAADVRENVPAHWIFDCERVAGDGWTHKQRHCSNCGFQTVECVNFCQNCGAVMRGKNDV